VWRWKFLIPILRIFYWLLMSVALRKALDVRKKPQSSLFQSLLPYKIMMLGIKAISCPHVDFNYQSVCSHPCAFIINFAPQTKKKILESLLFASSSMQLSIVYKKSMVWHQNLPVSFYELFRLFVSNYQNTWNKSYESSWNMNIGVTSWQHYSSQYKLFVSWRSNNMICRHALSIITTPS
jgi:hypothetical protein